MIPLPRPMNAFELQKQLPKKQSHHKEAAKIQFIKQIVQEYRDRGPLLPLDFDKSQFDGNRWNFIFHEDQETEGLHCTVSSVMVKWYFSNLSKNENIYFYRFLNVFRDLLTRDEWDYSLNHLLEHEDLNLRENTKVFCDYRSKLQEIEDLILKRDNEISVC